MQQARLGVSNIAGKSAVESVPVADELRTVLNVTLVLNAERGGCQRSFRLPINALRNFVEIYISNNPVDLHAGDFPLSSDGLAQN